MKVYKFGGTSVKTPNRIQNVIELVKQDTAVRAVICSAFGGVTDQLIHTAQQAANADANYHVSFQKLADIHLSAVRELIDIQQQSRILAHVKKTLNELEDVLQGLFFIKELSSRTLDYVSGFGERLSCYIIAEAAKNHGLDAEFLDTRDLIITDSHFGEAEVDFEQTNANIQKHFAEHSAVQITTGFIARNKEGVMTTLGRGGSDFTASIVASALDVSELEIWTDVDGVMTSDPRKVKSAFSIPMMTYREAMEMSHFGAKVIYPPTMLPVLKKKIPIKIKNTFNPSFEGTLISEKSSTDARPVKGISSIDNITLLRIEGSGMVGVSGVSGRLFGALAQARINIILITQASSEHSICLAVKPTDAERAKSIIEQEFAFEVQQGEIDPVFVETNLSVIAIVGENMRKTSGIAGKIFLALGRNGVNIKAVAQGSSEFNVSIVISNNDLEKGLRAVHQAFFFTDTKTINLFVVGVGLIGGTLLQQIEEQRQFLAEEYNLKFRIIGLANGRKMCFKRDGFSLKDWRRTLDKSDQKSDINEFVQQMKSLNLLNSVFVDNTASPEVASVYAEVLDASVSVVTPNKIAASEEYVQFQNLRTLAKKRNVIYLYETNVGAGLPVISTLKDLKASGDKIIRIEAILSGTLSYIFNTFDGSESFSTVVRQAKAAGYTEPDPRLDLSGTDVARKILILTRDAGFALELDEVKINGFLPESCLEAESVDDFFVELEKSDAYFEEMRAKASAEGKNLRYIARFENGQADIGLQAVDASHPFYSLSGSDNIIAFTTVRYPEHPLVVKGSGAGAEVTAAGVFADIIRVGNYL